MKSAYLHKTMLTALAIFVVSVAPAQLTNGQGRGTPRYDPAKEITLKGIVNDVKEQTCRNCGVRAAGVHLVLDTNGETIEVHVGPAWFLQKNSYTFSKGDTLEIIGSKVQLAGADVVLARQIRKGDSLMTLRDARGFPAWSGRRR